ncbi:MAG: hypothetical protein RDU20_21575 [Desulfomonilaceae bacterium]|nr:hypothetical protein [Desulfomonilaceae bacterium]
MDTLLQAQCLYDTDYFLTVCKPSLSNSEIEQLKDGMLKAYRWQYIFSGVEHPKYQELMGVLTTDEQRERLGNAPAGLA